MKKRAKIPSRRSPLDPGSRAQVYVAVLGAIAAIAGCVAQFAR